MSALQGEHPVVDVGRAETEDRGVARARDHHPKPVLAEDRHRVELDGEGRLALVDGGSALGRAHSARIDPAVTGVEEHRLPAIAGGGRVLDTGAVGEQRRVERTWLIPSSGQHAGHRAVPRVHRDARDTDQDDGGGDHAGPQAAGRAVGPGR